MREWRVSDWSVKRFAKHAGHETDSRPSSWVVLKADSSANNKNAGEGARATPNEADRNIRPTQSLYPLDHH